MRYSLLIVLITSIILLTGGCIGAQVISDKPTQTTPTTAPTITATLPSAPPQGPYDVRNVNLEVKRIDPQTISIKNMGGSDASSLINIWVNGGLQPTSGRVTSQVGSVAYYPVIKDKFVQVIGGFPDCVSMLWSDWSDSQLITPTPAPTRNPTFNPTFYPTLHPTPTAVPLPDSDYDITHCSWSFKGDDYTWELYSPKSLYEFYRSQPHNRQSDYAMYAMSDYDRSYLDNVVGKLENLASKEGFSKDDTVMFVVAFVQALPYVYDNISTVYDEYPRYPIETIADNGGDCEDTAILTAALLNEMGYSVVLLEYPTHIAVGVKEPDSFYGTYYEYNGANYYYLETTEPGWGIGEVPTKFKNTRATVYPMEKVPQISLKCSYTLASYDSYRAYYRVHCDISNIGTGTAKNIVIYVAALDLEDGGNLVWSPTETVNCGDYVEGSTGGWAEVTLQIPRSKTTQIECIASGDNFNQVKTLSTVFTT